MNEKGKNVGQAMSRIDGLLKVTGAAEYATDFKIKNPAHAFIFKSTIAAGRIIDIDQSEAEKSAGVLTVITHRKLIRTASEAADYYRMPRLNISVRTSA